MEKRPTLHVRRENLVSRTAEALHLYRPEADFFVDGEVVAHPSRHIGAYDDISVYVRGSGPLTMPEKLSIQRIMRMVVTDGSKIGSVRYKGFAGNSYRGEHLNGPEAALDYQVNENKRAA